jgi:hypothetical protein
MITQAELDALPESGSIGLRDEIRDGVKMRVPFFVNVGALWEDEGDGVVTDVQGQRWRVGRLNGVRVKQRI